MLRCADVELNLAVTLGCGQCFEWVSHMTTQIEDKKGEDGVEKGLCCEDSVQRMTFIGPISGHAFSLFTTPGQLHFKCHTKGCNLSDEDHSSILKDYFRLDILMVLYSFSNFL